MSGYHVASPKGYKSAHVMELIDGKCKVLKKKNKVQSDVKVGMWKCSGTTSRNVHQNRL
jgi:hypothetical protein